MKYILSILSGFLVALSFPMVFGDFSFLNGGLIAWISLVPLLIAIHDESPRKTFILVMISSVIWYTISIFWVYFAMNRFGGMGVLTSISVTILLIIIVSVYISIFIALARFISSKVSGGNIVWIPFMWLLAEWARNYFPANGFPWANIAMSQWKSLPVIQISAITGVYGVIFLIVFVNEYLASTIKEYSETKKISVHKTIATLILVLATLSFGYKNLSEPFVEKDNAIMIGAIQPNIPQDMKWSPHHLRHTIKLYKELTEKLSKGGSNIIVWPETSLQLLVPLDIDAIRGFEGFVPEGNIIISGFLEGNESDLYNSMFALEYDGAIIDKYRKQHLVPFGEYVPYKKLLFFVEKITALAGEFSTDGDLKPISTDIVNIGPLICYEDVFPELSRKMVNLGAEILINVTNDAWYGKTSAANQHMALSVFRSVETNRYTVRSANTGVSAIISPRGKIIVSTPIFEEAVIAAPIFPLTNKTFFTKYGDWFPMAIAFPSLIGLLLAVIISIKERRMK